jgi:hypothetical protein
MKHFEKQFGCKAVAIAGADITPAMLAKINAFALSPLTAEQVYVRKFLLCHSGIDRDVERFPPQLLDNFAATLPGKSFLFVHDRRSLPFGLFFDAAVEAMSPKQFKALTGADAKLPEGETSISVVWAWSYMLNEDFNAPIMKNIDGGVYRHVSIGFAATDLTAVKKEINGPTLYWEYVAPGEALEGSLVWLGAQPGATAQKQAKERDENPDHKGGTYMKTLIALIAGLFTKSLAPELTEEQLAAEIKGLISAKDARIAELETKAQGLETDAQLGKAYREKTVADYVALKHKLKEVGDEPEKHVAMKAVAAGLPFDFLESEVKSLQARVEKAFPAEGKLPGADGEESRTKSEDNPLVPKEAK